MTKYSFKKYQPLSLRLWHWLSAIAILGLLFTVLLRKTLLSWRSNSVLIQEKLNLTGTSITPDLAKEIAVAIRNPLWEWHIYLGFALTALLFIRLIVAVFIEKKSFNFAVFKNILQVKALPNADRRSALHFNFVKLSYVIFYLATLLMVITGLLLNFKSDLGLTKNLVGTVKEIHEFMMWFFVIFVAGHIVGVVIAENREDKGIISDMVNGGDFKNL